MSDKYNIETDVKYAVNHLEDTTTNNNHNNNKEGSNSSDHHNDVIALPRSLEDREREYRDALAVDPGFNLWSFRGFQFIGLVLSICLCGGDSGLDATTMSSINGMKQFQTFFGLAGAAPKTGLLFGIYTIGSLIGAIFASYLPDKVGRRWAMFVGNWILIAGALLSANATGTSMFIAGRFLTGFGCTGAANAAKAYMAELAMPAHRGKCMGILNSFYYIGQILASGIAVPAGKLVGDIAWRIPLFIQLGFPAINIAVVLFLPESPRWLYSRGKVEEARKVLTTWHSRDQDPNSPVVLFEIAEIDEVCALAKGDKNWWDFRRVVAKGQRYRLMLAFMVSVYGQLSGNGLITYFLTILLAQAGITDQNRILTLNFVNSITSFAGALTGTALVDRVGRRKLMLFACVSCCIGMFLVGGLTSSTGNIYRSNAGVIFIFLFQVFFSVGWTPLQGLYPAEVLSFENRIKGLSLQAVATQAVSCINTFGLPSALAALTWKVYIIFGAFDFLGIFIIYFFAVETRGLALEEIDQVFKEPHPRNYSLQYQKERRMRAKQDRDGRA